MPIRIEERYLLVYHKPEISRRDVEKILGTSSFPAIKVLNSLILKDKIETIGHEKNTRYVL